MWSEFRTIAHPWFAPHCCSLCRWCLTQTVISSSTHQAKKCRTITCQWPHNKKMKQHWRMHSPFCQEMPQGLRLIKKQRKQWEKMQNKKYGQEMFSLLSLEDAPFMEEMCTSLWQIEVQRYNVFSPLWRNREWQVLSGVWQELYSAVVVRNMLVRVYAIWFCWLQVSIKCIANKYLHMCMQITVYANHVLKEMGCSE